jgi:hypothetical protein
MIELLIISRIVHKSPFRMYVLQGHESGNLEISSIMRQVHVFASIPSVIGAMTGCVCSNIMNTFSLSLLFMMKMMMV